jgi:hypothetical protein
MHKGAKIFKNSFSLEIKQNTENDNFYYRKSSHFFHNSTKKTIKYLKLIIK